MSESTEELEPLFDYSRVQPFDPVCLDDDDSSPAFLSKRRKLSVAEKEPIKGEGIQIVDCEDNEEEDWLPPPSKISIDTQNRIEDSTLKELRLKKQELLSCAQSAENAMRTFEESGKRDLSASLQFSLDSVAEPQSKPASNPPCERAKIIISIQDKDGLKNFRVYMDDKFERLFKIYADKVKLDMLNLAFCFDGDKISPTATPVDLGMEDNDIIEVHVKALVTFEVKSSSSTLPGAPCSSHPIPAFYKGKQESTCFILQQIFDLKKLQTDGSNSSSFIRRQEHSDVSVIESDSTWKLENNLDQHLQHSLGLDSEFELMDSPNQDLQVDPFPFPFSQLDHLTSSATGGGPLQGDSIWQCKSPVQSGQLWSQNMQDLGVCEELGYLDEPSMPDIDLTFRNFEELFGGGEQEPTRALLNDISMACPIVEKDARGVEDTSVATLGRATQSACVKKDVGPSDMSPYFLRIWDCSHPIRLSDSALSVSLSMHSAESSGTDYIDTGLSPFSFSQKPSCNSLDKERAQPEAKEVVRTSYKDKKKFRRCGKQVGYTSRKARDDVRKWVRDQLVKAEGCNSDTGDAARSH